MTKEIKEMNKSQNMSTRTCISIVNNAKRQETKRKKKRTTVLPKKRKRQKETPRQGNQSTKEKKASRKLGNLLFVPEIKEKNIGTQCRR